MHADGVPCPDPCDRAPSVSCRSPHLPLPPGHTGRTNQRCGKIMTPARCEKSGGMSQAVAGEPLCTLTGPSLPATEVALPSFGYALASRPTGDGCAAAGDLQSDANLMAKRFYIIDGHAHIFRAYFAPFRELTSPE